MTGAAASLFPQLTQASQFPLDQLLKALDVSGKMFRNTTQHGQIVQPGTDPLQALLGVGLLGSQFFKPFGVGADVDALIDDNPGNIFGGGPVFGMPPALF